MIKIIGTNHLDSKEKIEGIIKDFNPEVIGIELDQTRINALILNPVKERPKDNTILGKISEAVRKKAEAQKLEYGSDMITAFKYARDNGLEIVLVDKDISEIRELMQKIPQNELQGFLKAIKEFEQQDLRKEVNETEFLSNLKQNFPISFEFLLTMREAHIENMILKTMLFNPHKRILIILGKGHVNRIKESIKGLVE